MEKNKKCARVWILEPCQSGLTYLFAKEAGALKPLGSSNLPGSANLVLSRDIQKMKKLLGLFLIYFLIISFLILRFDLGYILSMFLYLGIPSTYFSFKNPILIKKCLFYAFSFSIPSVVFLDYMAHVSNAWYVPSVFQIRMLGAFPAEEILWAFLFFYANLVVYNSIYVKDFDPRVSSPNNKYLLAWIVGTGTIFFLIFSFNKELLVIDNFYILMVLFLMALPTIIAAYFYPYFIRKVLPLTIVFIVFSIVFYEYTALKTGGWFFNGVHYIGWIQFFDVRFPIEEFLFAVFSLPGTIAIYTLFSNHSTKKMSSQDESI